ncbi:MAG: HU family DNA-binding protein, partial [Deltaproteobacteria bacterium]|nr:HU family DNA-binding protein [Deltaproteobacteria bacterium]
KLCFLADIIKSIYNNCGYSKNKSTELIKAILGTIKNILESGEGIFISGLGEFCSKIKNERRVRTPAIGSDLTLGARRIVTFQCSPV